MTAQPRSISPRASSPATKISRNNKRHRQQSFSSVNRDAAATPEIEAITFATLILTPALSMPSPTRLLVCSIGNPGALINTLHSAGHLVISTLCARLSYPSFRKSRSHGNGLVSIAAEHTLWQSTSFMNISGVGVAAAWRQFVKDNKREGEEVGLVVVHDELESKVGEVKVKKGVASAKGHNGLKSINEQLRGTEYTRIGVGIGRPESREPDVVAGYVLRKVSAMERVKIEGAVVRVEEELRKLAGR